MKEHRKNNFILLQEPIETMVISIIERVREKAWEEMETVWREGIPESWIEHSIHSYEKEMWDTQIPQHLFEMIMGAISLEDIYRIEKEIQELQTEWENENTMFMKYGMSEQDFL